MIVRAPTNTYEREILNIIKTREDFKATITKYNKDIKQYELVPVWSEGEKSIIYDLCVHDIPAFIQLNWQNMDLDNYITIVKNTYLDHKTMVTINLVSQCINNLKIGYLTKIQYGELVFLRTGEK